MDRLEVDCSTGEVKVLEMTHEEVAEHQAAQDASQAELAAAEAQAAQDLALVARKAAADPAFAALTRLLGLNVEPIA